jgi:hypothetical protein
MLLFFGDLLLPIITFGNLVIKTLRKHTNFSILKKHFAIG